VWIGDSSAFPTPSGTNPMITIMALASRTAEHIAQAAGASTTTTQQQEIPA
jgi:choline dehydrogenase-like flavoprotein